MDYCFSCSDENCYLSILGLHCKLLLNFVLFISEFCFFAVYYLSILFLSTDIIGQYCLPFKLLANTISLQ